MCYSAQIIADYRKYTKLYGADIDIKEFARLFWERQQGSKAKVPKALAAPFLDAHTDEERRIQALIAEFDADQAAQLEQDLFKQRARLADANRALQTKTTKAATESRRIATGKIDWAIGKLADLRRTELKDRDARIFPGQYAPVMLMEHGRRVIKPMRYQCRPAGKPAFYDVKYPGTYNARRDNLGGFWKGLFGYTHGLIVVNAFYENVNRHRVEHRELAEGEAVENVVLEFKPNPPQDMLVACLWSHWQGKGEPDLLSFAAITDDPPAEIALAGHDRCIVPIKREHIDAWLNPDPQYLADQYAILDDRNQPYYEYRQAA
ncbi:SOS response-associated peptidase family protein [Burkholderia sp. L27(2015)]|uniref:SOS response-associated peptidase family protein n=1 Tax=Burkholderia sp. L27(2015) TaxID=1641858 RepID=UPI00131C6018|nr:SOS response-associated peptidase family protein [Burkholderia sp. L27(2015)]